MILKIVAIRDRAADAFMQPSFVLGLGIAERAFRDEINNPQSVMAKHPEDYDLYQLGSFNDENGEFDVHSPRQLSIGKDQVTSKE